MNHKIIATLLVLIFAVSCLCVAAEDNNTTELETIEEDTANYIMPISISGNRIEFSDGFTGFCLDLTKEAITADDGFVSQGTGGDQIQNYVKLAIIEAYRQGCEDNLDQIIASFADGSYKTSSNEVVTAVLNSQESVGDSAVVELEDSIEGTFEFELLKPATGDKSDCLAYKVYLKEMPNDDKLGAAAEDNVSEETDNDDALANATEDIETENATETEESQAPIVNETNNTLVNVTNTTVNVNNTANVNQTNIHINNTVKDKPQNDTIPAKLMKTAGNPIFILIVVIAIAAIAAFAMRRKG